MKDGSQHGDQSKTLVERMMGSANEPLRETEVGAFGELAQRPNPENLVILSIPAIEDLLPSMRAQLGRDLTPEEIEIQRHKAPAIVVSRAMAEKMLAARAKRPPAAPSESASRIPRVTTTFKDMPTESAARKETAVDVFGQHLFFMRNQLVERLSSAIECEEHRKRLGSMHRQEYDAISALGPAERDAALGLARKTIDLYMQDILALFTGTGDSLRYGDDYAVNYRVVLEVKEVASNQIVEEFEINRKCKKTLYNYYGRWLNRYGNHR